MTSNLTCEVAAKLDPDFVPIYARMFAEAKSNWNKNRYKTTVK